MARRKKQSTFSGCILITGIAFVILILISLISRYKGAFLGLIVIGIIIFIIYKLSRSSAPQSQANTVDSITLQQGDGASLIIRPSLSIPHPRILQPSLLWYGKGSQIRIGNYTINDPMTYYSEDTTENMYSSIAGEASCIYSSLPVGAALDEGKGSLGYWPRYSRISPNQRANYLEWLAGGRKGNLNDIGYAFIYFYGLERRTLIEKKDIGVAVQETIALLSRYTFSGSFSSYLSKFVSYTIAQTGLDRITPDLFKYIYKATPISSFEEGIAVGLAWFYKHSVPLPNNWAKKVAGFDQRSSRGVVVDRFPENFNRLFSQKYKERFNNGMMLNAHNKDRAIDYAPASPTFQNIISESESTFSLPTAIIPNVIGLQHQFDPIVDIWNQCVEELKPLSRKVSRGISTGSREAYESLPEELRKHNDHPDRQKWEKSIAANKQDNGFSIPKVSSLAEIQGIEKKLSLTLKESTGLTETAGYMKFAVEPDSRITKVPYKWDDAVAVYSPQGEKIITDNPQYVNAAFILELGISVAYADGFYDKKEADHISQTLEYLFILDSSEIQRLEALKQVLARQKPSLLNIKKRFHRSFSESDIEKICGFLVSVANADGSVSQKEIAVLKQIYRAFGIEGEKIKHLIASLQVAPTEPVVVKEGNKTKTIGELIPERQPPTKAIHIDLEKLRKKREDTIGISTTIATIMKEGISVNSLATSQDTNGPILTETKGRLDKKYHSVLRGLLLKKTFERTAFITFAKEYGLMPNDAIDAINDWSLDRYGTLLIEGESILTIDESVSMRINNELKDRARRT